MPGRLATIGYQGASPAALVATLQAAGVEMLVDVRAVPWSRRPEFAGKALAAAAEAAGLGYRHMPALGNPAEGRTAAKAGDLAGYRRIFEVHLDAAPAQAALAELAALAGDRACCLLCLERDPAHCHRGIVAARLAAAYGFAVEHLSVPSGRGPSAQLPLI